MSVSVCLDYIFWITEHFVTKFSMVMQCHKPECPAEFCCCCYLQGQGHSEGSYDENMILSIILSELLTLWLIVYHQQPESSVKKIELLHSTSRSQWRVKMLIYLSRQYLLNHQTFCFQTWYCECDASLSVRVSCKKIDLLFSRSRLLQELIWSKYDNFYCIFWTTDPFSTQLCLILHYHEP